MVVAIEPGSVPDVWVFPSEEKARTAASGTMGHGIRVIAIMPCKKFLEIVKTAV